MLIWIASYPRSGNKFFRQVLSDLYGMKCYEIFDPQYHKDYLRGDTRQLDAWRKAEGPVFVKTHYADLPHEDRVVYLLRDGRDTLVSLAHFILQIELKRETVDPIELDNLLRRLILHGGHFGTWAEHIDKSMRHPQHITVRYADMLDDAAGTMGATLKAFGLDMKKKRGAKIKPFEQSQQEDPLYFRKGECGGWREYFTPELEVLFWERYGDMMTHLGYER